MTQDETPGEVLDRLGMDGVKWAAEFRKTALQLGYSDMDEGWLIGWFCNAIMAGYDRAPRADIAQAPAPVRVKALNWDKHPDDDEYYAPIFFDGEGGELNCYVISQDSTGLEWLVYLRNDVMEGYHPTLEAAKAAAQADYEARILAALEAPDAGVVAELVEALRWYGEQSRRARLIHSEGDAGRHAIAADGGKRAAALIAKLETHA